MAEAKDTKPRIFVKKGPGDKTLTREVTGPASEVAAKFDGFEEQASGSRAATGASTKASPSS